MAQKTQRQEAPRRADADSVSALAERALKVLADRRLDRREVLSEPILAGLEAAVCDPDPSSRNTWMTWARTQDIADEAITDLYIPEVAHRLGRAWSADEMSFTQVTIGTARLQAMLRDIWDTAADSASTLGEDAASVVVMVLSDEYHTLGAMVLTGQLRRLGISVRLVLGRPPAEVAAMLRDGNFDAVLMSVPLKEDFSDVRHMVSILRGAAMRPCPLIVGGGILQSPGDVRALTGADHATNDLQEALAIFVRRLGREAD